MAEAAVLEAEGAIVQSLRIGNHHDLHTHASGRLDPRARSWVIFVEALSNCHGIAHVDFSFGAPLNGRCRSITGSVARTTPYRVEPFDVEIEVLLLRGGKRTFTHRLCFDGDGSAGTRVHNVVIRPRRSLPVAPPDPFRRRLQERADRSPRQSRSGRAREVAEAAEARAREVTAREAAREAARQMAREAAASPLRARVGLSRALHA